jgi:hypothetical protein
MMAIMRRRRRESTRRGGGGIIAPPRGRRRGAGGGGLDFTGRRGAGGCALIFARMRAGASLYFIGCNSTISRGIVVRFPLPKRVGHSLFPGRIFQVIKSVVDFTGLFLEIITVDMDISTVSTCSLS